MANRFPDVAHKVSGLMNGLPVRWFGLLFAALLSVSAYPALFVYCYNIKEAVFAQVFPPVIIFAAIGLAAWLIFGLLSATMSKGACIALIFLLVFMNYALIEHIIRWLVPGWRWWRIAPAFLFLFINLALILRVFVKRPEGDAAFTKITTIIGAVFLALTLFNAARATYTQAGTLRMKSSPAVTSASLAEEPLADSFAGKRPNFYFFIFDEYARADILNKFFGFDNTPFIKELESKKFNVSYSSYSSAHITYISVGNSLNYCLKYKNLDEAMQGTTRRPLLDLFKKAGYKTYALSPACLIDEDLVDVKLKEATALAILSIEQTVMDASFISYLHEHGNEKICADKLSLLKQAAAIVEEKTEKPKFLFFHFMGPHKPYVFDENGGPVAYQTLQDHATDPQYYLGQLRFLSKKINELADTILAKDPHAVVLLQSDHGYRLFWEMQEKERLACFNSLYVYGQDIDIQGLSQINTLRLALNHALGLKLELVRDEQ